MKKIYLLIFMLACFHLAKATNPVPNSSFEDWTSGSPDSWTTDNVTGLLAPITQTSPGNTGSYAVKGQTVTDGSGDTLSPVLETQGSGYGFPVTQNYDNLEFYYKSNLVGGDVIIAVVLVYDATPTPIGYSLDTIYTNASGFTKVDFPIAYGSGVAATMEIEFYLASVNSSYPKLASYFIIDDVSLSGLEAGVPEITTQNKLQVFPVPAHDFLTVKGQTENNKPMQFLLLDEAGRVVMEKKSETPSGNFIDTEFNLQGIAPGFYSLMMITDEKILNQRIIVQ